MSLKKCVYCGQDKLISDFSDEHIWPDALGGDFLEPFWRTGDVCGRCNSLSGMFVDGAFIKNLFGDAERSSGARDYIDVSRPDSVRIPLNYLGRLKNPAVPPDETAEYWAGPCGANILHVRPADNNDQWGSYAGGNPSAKKLAAGRAYMALTSSNPFWVQVSFNSFKAHFKRARRFVTNLQLNPQQAKAFTKHYGLGFPDLNDPVECRDMDLMNEVVSAGRNKTFLKTSFVIQLDTGTRMLAKLALALGYKLFAIDFLDSQYANTLRSGLWQRDPNERKKLPINGTGYLGPQPAAALKGLMSWPGGWVLILKTIESLLMLSVFTPSGRTMFVTVTDSSALLTKLDRKFMDGIVWITIPSLAKSVGPIGLPEYLADRAGIQRLPALTEIEAMRIDPSSLPPCD